MQVVWFSVLIAAILQEVEGFKVIGVFPIAYKSHFAIGHSIVMSLHDAGHEITVVSPHPMKNPIKNYRDISKENIFEVHQKSI